MTHSMKLQDEPFALIASGQKRFELRLYDEKRKSIRVGDEIEFVHATDNQRRLRCVVLNLHLFDTFEVLYQTLPLLLCGYTEENLASASSTDMEKYYSRDQQATYGVVGIEIQLLS